MRLERIKTLDGARAKLTMPSGQVMDLTETEWREVARSVRSLFPKTTSRPDGDINHPKTNTAWSAELDAQLASFGKRGFGDKRLAEHFGRTRGSIETRLSQLGILKLKPMSDIPSSVRRSATHGPSVNVEVKIGAPER